MTGLILSIRSVLVVKHNSAKDQFVPNWHTLLCSVQIYAENNSTSRQACNLHTVHVRRVSGVVPETNSGCE